MPTEKGTRLVLFDMHFNVYHFLDQTRLLVRPQ